MTNDIEVEVRAFIQENFVMGEDAAAISADESFLDTGIIDSTGVLELIGFLEDKLGIQVADDEMIPANLDSIANVVRFVMQKRTSARTG